FQIPLYVRRGYPIAVQCTPEKAPLFEAAGATVVTALEQVHPYLHAPVEANDFTNHWNGSKPGWNVSQPPAPNIGDYRELWKEYCDVKLSLDSFITPDIQARIFEVLEGLPRPIILTHFQGNTSPEAKNISHEIQAEAIRGLL